jgi:hypothetical protein
MAKARKSTFGEDLIEAMGEVVAHARGVVALPTWIVDNEADIGAIGKEPEAVDRTLHE